MSSTAVLAAALALLCVAAALWFVQRGARHSGRTSAERFIDSHIASATRGGGAAMPGVAPLAVSVPGASGSSGAAMLAPAAVRQASSAGTTASARKAAGPQAAAARIARDAASRSYWRVREARAADALRAVLNRAGLAHLRPLLAVFASCAVLLCVFAAAYGGWPAAAATCVACALAFYVLLSSRTRARRRRIVRQLPSFLDGIVRLVVLGNSVPAAFQAALQTTEAPLRECLDHVSRMLRTGVEIDRALQHVGELYRVSEFELVGAVLRLSVKYGGRADTMLDRMASFMRDLEQAERELSAMSAETRLSSWVLALLPVGIGAFLILSNPRYFASMWHDGTGRQLVYLAFGLQAAGIFLLVRLVRLRR
jgi:tight adherence protein B